MKRTIFILILVATGLSINAQQNCYEQAYFHIENMLTDKVPLNFRDAVLFTEYAYYDGALNTQLINEEKERREHDIRYKSALRLLE